MARKVSLPKCEWCKSSFVPKRYGAKFCKTECKDKSFNKKKKLKRQMARKEAASRDG